MYKITNEELRTILDIARELEHTMPDFLSMVCDIYTRNLVDSEEALNKLQNDIGIYNND